MTPPEPWSGAAGSQFDLVLIDMRMSEERFREMGFDDQLFQPFSQSEMHAMLSKHPGPRAVADATDPAAPASVDTALGPASTSIDAAQPVLDPAALARLAELDPKGENRLLERVLKAFQTSVARLRPQAEAARHSGDRAAIRLVVHTLKSSSASIGAMHLSRLCAQIEAAIRLDPQADLDADLDALGAALEVVLDAIEQWLKAEA